MIVHNGNAISQNKNTATAVDMLVKLSVPGAQPLPPKGSQRVCAFAKIVVEKRERAAIFPANPIFPAIFFITFIIPSYCPEFKLPQKLSGNDFPDNVLVAL